MVQDAKRPRVSFTDFNEYAKSMIDISGTEALDGTENPAIVEEIALEPRILGFSLFFDYSEDYKNKLLLGLVGTLVLIFVCGK